MGECGTLDQLDKFKSTAFNMTRLFLSLANFETCKDKLHVAIQMNHFGRTFAWSHSFHRILQKIVVADIVIVNFCSKEPKSVTAFDLFTFFCTDLIQSEANWKLHVLELRLVNVYMKEHF